MTGEGHGGDASGAVRPGALSALLQELASAPAVGSEAGGWDARLRAGETVGRFELVRELGRGGFGVVWEARDRELGRRVAFKAVRAGSRRDLREHRLLREAEAAARLSHPNIVTLFDVGRSEQGPYLVLELLEGRTLSARLAEGAIPVREAVRIALEVAKGLAHAHGHGVVHRDLKPENVFLCDDGQVKVLDFGLAHAFGQRRIDGGTPAYMAPEQAEGSPEDERTDVWALGAILFEMLSGRPAFEDEKALRSRIALKVEVTGEPALGALVSRMLARKARDRPRDGEHVLARIAAIERELAHAPSAARKVRATTARIRKAERPQQGEAPRRASSPSIAVLPFVDMSPGSDQEHFADGIAEEILSALTRVDGLKVVGRTSSFSFKGKGNDLRSIGRRLGASTVLEGSIRREGERVRVTAQLVKASDGYHLWSDCYDRDLKGTFQVQDEIARAVVASLKLTLLPEKGSGAVRPQLEAHTQYLLGRQLQRQGSEDGYRRAEKAYRAAIELDPHYAPAHVGLSEALWGRYRAGDTQSAEETDRVLKEILAAAQRAVELSPDLAEAVAHRGAARAGILWDWQGSLEDHERALAMKGNAPEILGSYGFLLGKLGRFRAGIASLTRAAELDPLSAETLRLLGYVLMAAGERSRARDAFAQALEVAPHNDWALQFQTTSLLLDGQAAEALATMDRSRTEVWRLWGHVLANHSLGNEAESRRALDVVVERWAHVGTYQIAQAIAWRGERDRAFEWLERCYREHDVGLTYLKLDQLVRDLRGDRRWPALLRRMNLPPD